MFPCTRCRSLKLLCEEHFILATSTGDPSQKNIAMEDYDQNEDLESIMQSLPDWISTSTDGFPADYEAGLFQSQFSTPCVEDRVVADPQSPLDSGGADIRIPIPPHFVVSPTEREQQATETADLASWPSTQCHWHDGTPTICNVDISYPLVPSHFKEYHHIRNMGPDEPIYCKWRGCSTRVSRKNFVRHIRETHLGYSRF